MITARWQALIRLLAVQASWTYERMGGIGVAHAAAPLLREVLRNRTATERRDAIARSAEYFNSHPYLAGVAVGAVVKSERDGIPGPGIIRLRTALSGPLGSIGDQLIWAGEVPAVMGLALCLVPWIGWWAVLLVLLIHNIIRLRLTLWGLDLGLREGINVGGALLRSWLPPAAAKTQQLAAFAVGMAIPIITAWQLRGLGTAFVVAVVILGVLGAMVLVAPVIRIRVTGIRLGLLLMILAGTAMGVLS